MLAAVSQDQPDLDVPEGATPAAATPLPQQATSRALPYGEWPMRDARWTVVSVIALVLATTVAAVAQRPMTPAAAASGRGGALPEMAYTRFTLPNGLRVVFHQDHSTPVVAVNVWYHVGSMNEVAGRTGFAHLFEHLMLQGFEGYPYDFLSTMDELGAVRNATTHTDRTNYFELVPSNFLETALFMEAGRMGRLLPTLTQQRLDNQRDVVKNEKRQRIDNQPYARAYPRMLSLLYPREHPYSWPVLGSMEDLTAASLDDVSAFYRTYYAPNNASLVLAGDFEPAKARALVERYFGPFPRAPWCNGRIRRRPVSTARFAKRWRTKCRCR